MFGAEKITPSAIDSIEKDTPNMILWALPLVFLFVLIEAVHSFYHRNPYYDLKETIGSVLIGLGNLAVSALVKVLLILGAVLIYNAIPWRMEFTWWSLIPCLLVYDFCSYWSHRISHSVRFFWATHVVHHSAEHFNLTVSFRQSWVQHFKILFFLPVALLGFHPIIFFMANQVSTLYQFWVHTEKIGRLHPLIERYFCTPSNHRVHHGSQPKYLDKNYGAVFMIWDHLFGTFVPEEERPDYGLTSPVNRKIDPVYLNFHEYADIIRDVRKARGLKTKLFYLFGRPAEIAKEKKDIKQQNPA